MAVPIKTKLTWPVSLSEAKRHLRVYDEEREDDNYIQDLIYAATAKAEQYIGKDIAETNNTQQIYDYIDDSLYIKEGNFISFTQAVTDASALCTVDHVDTFYNYTYVEFTNSYDSDPLTITYKTGFNEGECPALIKQAILIKIADLYDVDRQSYLMGSLKENKAFEALLNSFQQVIF